MEEPAHPSESHASEAGHTRTAKILVAAALAALTVLARLPDALGEPLWQDEVGVERVVSKPTVARALKQIVGHESTPPAFYLVARAVDRLSGPLASEDRARTGRVVLSVGLSAACTVLTFILACQLLALWAAAVAGFLASFASALVVHGAELRAYSLLALMCVAFALALDRGAASPTRRRLVMLAIVVSVGALTHYFFLSALAGGAVWLVVSGRGRPTIKRVFVVLALGLIPLLVWSPLWYLQYRNGVYATSPPFSLSRFLEIVPSLLAPQPLISDTSTILHALVTVAVLVSASLLLRIREGRLCALMILVPFLVVSGVVLLTGERVFNTRNLVGMAPFVAIVLAWACSSIPSRRVSHATATILAATVIAGFMYAQAAYDRTPYDGIARELRAQGYGPGQPLLWLGTRGGISPVGWYLTPDAPPDMWPRLAHAEQMGGRCSVLEVVARSETGRSWLNERRSEMLAMASIASYGDVLQGGRGEDIVVARLPWAPRLLEGIPAGPGRTFWLYLAGSGRPPCLKG